MWAQPDVLQHPRQLSVCGHAMSCHLPAGLQPRVRAGLAGGGGQLGVEEGGMLSAGSWAAYTLAPTHLDPSSRPGLRQRPSEDQRGQPCLNSRAGPLCPQGSVPSWRAPACRHCACQLARTLLFPAVVRQHGALGTRRGQSWERTGWGRAQRCTHMGTHEHT